MIRPYVIYEREKTPGKSRIATSFSELRSAECSYLSILYGCGIDGQFLMTGRLKLLGVTSQPPNPTTIGEHPGQ